MILRETDYHCHLLPGIDDGPADTGTSLEMASLLYGAGYRQVYCTPHLIKGMYEASHGEVLEARAKLQAELVREGIGIRLLLGREYFLDEFLLELMATPQLLEGTSYLMVEIPSQCSVELVKETLFRLCRKGYIPMIAHPERCRLLEVHDPGKPRPTWASWLSKGRAGEPDAAHGSNGLLDYLRQLGCQFQGNLCSITNFYGEQVKASALQFEKTGIYTHFGTDAHSPDAVRRILSLS